MEQPKFLLKDILWSFDNPNFDSIEAFKNELVAYNEKITKKTFELDLKVEILKGKQVVVQYIYWEDEEMEEPQFLLTADNNFFFTGEELLFKVHNAVCEKLQDADNIFFEGFQLWQGENPNYPNIPLYFLLQGS